MNKQERLNRASKARQLLNDPTLAGAFDEIEKTYIRKMVESKKGEESDREYYHTCVNAIKDVKNVLTIFLEDGKIAERKLRKDAKKR